MRIDVALVPRRARAMTPYEVMLSESQERMLVVARPGRERDVERIFKKWELHGSRIGEVTAEPTLLIYDGDDLVASLPPRSLADGAPEYDVASLAHAFAASGEGSVVLGGPSLDHVGSRVPLRAPAPSPEPQAMTAKIGLERLDLLASPALAITDCINVGNPERPKGAWQLTRTIEGIAAACDALGVPVVSGNVSLYNAMHGTDIWPAAVIGAVGRFADVTKHIAPTSGRPGDL